jgi:hypothetical protein
MPQLALEREATAELHRWFRQGAARRRRRGRRVHGDSVTFLGENRWIQVFFWEL